MSTMKTSSPSSGADSDDNESEAYDTLAPLPEDLLIHPHEIDDDSLTSGLPDASFSSTSATPGAAGGGTVGSAQHGPIDTRRTSHSGRPIFPVRNPTVQDMVQAKKLVAYLQKKYGFVFPDRGNLDDQSVLWKEGKPDYTIADLHYFLGKTKNHPPGSLELFVENFIKTWEMEATHKEFYQWNTVDQSTYTVCSNGGRVFDCVEGPWVGNYNWLLSSCQPEKWDSTKETFESSHGKFRYAFPEGFPFEVLQVFSGPPRVTFSWRHWAVFSGEFEGNQGTGETINMTGFGIAELNDDLKAKSINIYFDPDSFIDVLRGNAQCRDGKDRGFAFGEPIAGGLDAVASMMAMMELGDEGTKAKPTTSPPSESKDAEFSSKSRCPFSGASL